MSFATRLRNLLACARIGHFFSSSSHEAPVVLFRPHAEHRDECFELLDQLDNHWVLQKLDTKSRTFVEDMKERRARYGDEMFVSQKQVFWLRDLHERFVLGEPPTFDDVDEPK